jgi:diguanylate cyclase
LNQSDIVERLVSIVTDQKIAPGQLMFEITESIAMQDALLSVETIKKFQENGFDIAIDDFGTGYSSLAYLQRFRVKQLKIDRFFTRGLDEHGEEGAAIVSAIIALAHALRMEVVAEGVETASQLQELKGMMCDEIQGFHTGRPLNADDFGRLLAGANSKTLIPAT